WRHDPAPGAYRLAGSPAPAGGSVSATVLRRRRRFDLLRAQFGRAIPKRGRLRRSHPQGREARRLARAGTAEIRTGRQPQARQGNRDRGSADAARPRRRGDRVRRREFITLLGGAAAAWPLAVRAQQGERVRRIGVLTSLLADNPQALARNAAFLQGL